MLKQFPRGQFYNSIFPVFSINPPAGQSIEEEEGGGKGKEGERREKKEEGKFGEMKENVNPPAGQSIEKGNEGIPKK